jgi:lyso-ornithine lipid O-acyltransferase
MVSLSAARIDAAEGRPPRVSLRGWGRFWGRVAALLLVLILLLPLHYATHLLGMYSHWPRTFLFAATRICGARVRVVGTPVKRNVFFIGNHLSWLDILAMGGATGTAFIAKAELEKVTIVGWLADINRTLYVSREDKMGVGQQIARVREAMAENHAITVFPEGTTTDGRSLLPFKSSLLAVLEPPPPGIMVQPVVLDYGDVGPDIGWIGTEHGKDNAIRILSRKGSFPLTIYFLEPFDPLLTGGRKAIAAQSRSQIEAKLLTLLDDPLRPFHWHAAP